MKKMEGKDLIIIASGAILFLVATVGVRTISNYPERGLKAISKEQDINNQGEGCLTRGSVSVAFDGDYTLDEIRDFIRKQGLDTASLGILEYYKSKPVNLPIFFHDNSGLTMLEKKDIITRLMLESGIQNCSATELPTHNTIVGNCGIEPELTGKDVQKVFDRYPEIVYKGISKWPLIPISVPAGAEERWYDRFKVYRGGIVSWVMLGLCAIE